MNKEWQNKLDKTIQQYEQKYDRQINTLNEEKKELELQLNDSKEAVKSLRNSLSSQTSKFDADTDTLKQNLEEMNLIKEKYERLQNKAIQMKETYDTRNLFHFIWNKLSLFYNLIIKKKRYKRTTRCRSRSRNNCRRA